MTENCKKLDPKKLEDRILIDPNGKIILSKSDKDFVLTIELPNGNSEKYVFKAGFEYMIQYDKDRNISNSRQLIGNAHHIVTELV